MKTETKHTPGPWQFQKIEKPAIGAVWYEIGIKPDSEFHKVCSVDGEGDARLIAASPELLDEAVNVAFHLESHGRAASSMTRRDAMILSGRLRAIIAKAGGH